MSEQITDPLEQISRYVSDAKRKLEDTSKKTIEGLDVLAMLHRISESLTFYRSQTETNIKHSESFALDTRIIVENLERQFQEFLAAFYLSLDQQKRQREKEAETLDYLNKYLKTWSR